MAAIQRRQWTGAMYTEKSINTHIAHPQQNFRSCVAVCMAAVTQTNKRSLYFAVTLGVRDRELSIWSCRLQYLPRIPFGHIEPNTIGWISDTYQLLPVIPYILLISKWNQLNCQEYSQTDTVFESIIFQRNIHLSSLLFLPTSFLFSFDIQTKINSSSITSPSKFKIANISIFYSFLM